MIRPLASRSRQCHPAIHQPTRPDAHVLPGPNPSPRLRRSRQRGQAKILDWGLALLLTASLILTWTNFHQRQERQARSLLLADQLTTIADAATTYVAQHYTAFEQWFSAPGVAQILEVTPSCVGGGWCLLPAIGRPVSPSLCCTGWQSLAGAGLLPPEHSNVNAAQQPYRLIIRCSGTTNDSCTQLSAIVTTFGGGTLTDSQSAATANAIGAGFIPQDVTLNGPYVAPAWLTKFAFWSVGGAPRATPGNVAISLDYDIGRDIVAGPIRRESGGDDTRPSTLSRTLVMGSDGFTGGPANTCFCGEDGYYHGACRPAYTQGIPDTPTSPNYCGVPP